MSTALDFPTTHREHTKHAEYREHRAHPSMAWTTESTTTLLPADTLPGPLARNTVSGRTWIWKGRCERVHRQSCTHAWIFLAHAIPRSIITFTNKQTKTVPLARCPQNLPKHFPFVACLSTHYYAAFSAFPFPFSLSSSRTCPATAKLVIGCLDFWLAFENWATRTKVMIERRKYGKDVRCCCVAKAAGRERSSDHYRRVLTRDGSPADDRFTDRWWPGWW